MSNQCDSLAVTLLNDEERKEEISRLSSAIYELNNEIKDLKDEYEEYQESGEYDELDSILSEICSKEDEKAELKSALLEFKETRVY